MDSGKAFQWDSGIVFKSRGFSWTFPWPIPREPLLCRCSLRTGSWWRLIMTAATSAARAARTALTWVRAMVLVLWLPSIPRQVIKKLCKFLLFDEGSPLCCGGNDMAGLRQRGAAEWVETCSQAMGPHDLQAICSTSRCSCFMLWRRDRE